MLTDVEWGKAQTTHCTALSVLQRVQDHEIPVLAPNAPEGLQQLGFAEEASSHRQAIEPDLRTERIADE